MSKEDVVSVFLNPNTLSTYAEFMTYTLRDFPYSASFEVRKEIGCVLDVRCLDIVAGLSYSNCIDVGLWLLAEVIVRDRSYICLA